eukprot:10084457-Lingulodinium_polyedra.AAC.1
MYKRRDPRALWKGPAGVAATSGLSGARSTGSGSSVGVSRPGVGSHGVPFTDISKAPSTERPRRDV